MKQHISHILDDFRQQMLEEGKSSNTISKYVRDLKQFLEYAEVTESSSFDKTFLQQYREQIGKRYLASSANSKISAVNYYLKNCEHLSLSIRSYRVQNPGFRSEGRFLSREEYLKLVRQAKKCNDIQLYLIMETLATTGIRISELRFVTQEAVEDRQMVIKIKGKVRTVLLPARLCRHLQKYAADRGIREGPVFVTRNDRPLDRSNILHKMKKLCLATGGNTEKVFPHNLRHLFALTYYETQKDVCHLADILGHSDINTTRIYTSMSCAEYRRKIEELDLFAED